MEFKEDKLHWSHTQSLEDWDEWVKHKMGVEERAWFNDLRIQPCLQCMILQIMVVHKVIKYEIFLKMLESR